VAVRRRAPAAAALSDPGRERENNEDRVLIEPTLGVYGVIDGVGGESFGEVAAETARDVLRARLSRRTTDSARLVREAIALANKQIWDRAQADRRLAGMSCVLTVAVLDGDGVTVGHVGDSRLYLLRPGDIRKITRDHSPVGVREDAGDISETDAMRHPRRNEIFRDVGSAPHEPDDADFIDVYQQPFAPDNALLLCSDGLSDLITSRDMLETVERHAGNPQGGARELVARANAAGGKDNISVVLVEGDRFAEAVRAAATGPVGGAAAAAAGMSTGSGGARGPARGAASAGSSRGSVLGRLARWAGLLLALLVLLVGLGSLVRRFGPGIGPIGSMGGIRGGSEPLRVGAGDGGYATLAEALARAEPGQTVEVGPGTYRERIVLPSGVAVVSRVPRGAVLVPPPAPAGSPAAPAVLAEGVRGARFVGFRIAADPAAPLGFGLLLVDSDVAVEEVEVTGTVIAAVQSLGEDRSTVRDCYLHANRGAGVAVAGQATPRLLGNLITGNGGVPIPGQAQGERPGIEVRDTARPLLARNRVLANGRPGSAQVVLPAGAEPALRTEIALWNDFGGLSGAQAVRSPAVAPAARPERPARSGAPGGPR
jgi:serine/threonine protein phosphatase PrpC